ncbi:MAG: PAS domain S-box protein, partial [Actinobacteria bacterium]|nr:PAS domain S-box protein [Actinomycetota bacterium]
MGGRSPLLEGHGDDFAWSLFDAAPDAIIVVATSGEIAFLNDAATSMFDCSLEDLLGRAVEVLVPAGGRDAHVGYRHLYGAHPHARPMGSGLELSALRPDGSEFPVEISLSPLHLGDEVFTVATVRDVSERVRAEEAYVQSQEALRQAEMRMA